MVDQAPIGRGSPAAKLGRNVSGYAHDVLTLAELQLRLLAVDLRDSSKTAGLGIGVLAAGAMAAIGAIPLVFVTLALALVEFAHWSYTASFALSAAAGVLFGIMAAWFGFKTLFSAGKTFGRSKQEAVETLKWIKESLRPGDSEPGVDPLRRF